MDIKNGVTLNAPPAGSVGGVTIVITGNYAVDLGNNQSLNITAPTTGDYAGIAMTSLRTANSSVTHVLENNAALNIQGALYFPSQGLEFSNNVTSNSNGCTEVVAGTVLLKQNVVLGNNCTGTGVKPIGVSTQLVE